MHWDRERAKEREESAGIAEEKDMCLRSALRPKERERDREDQVREEEKVGAERHRTQGKQE